MANPEHLARLKEGVEAWNEWRKDNTGIAVDLSRVDLPKADLRGADLSKATLSGSNLGLANLSHANLRGARFGAADVDGLVLGANLIATDLSHANLRGANLGGAVLFAVNLAGADLTDTSFSGALLGGGNFSGSVCFSTAFIKVDLSDVKGLELVVHRGPSSIGIDTLYNSKGKIPEHFLRGCGIPDEMIEYAKSLVSSPIEFYSCFISYSHKDESFAQRLHDQLQAKGIRCWLDEHDLKPGDRILDAIDNAIRLHDRVLLCCSQTSLGSWWVKDEVRKTLERERTKSRDILIPLDLDGHLHKWTDGLASDIRSRLAADFTRWESDTRFDSAFEKLVKALRADAGARETPPEAKL